MKKTIAMLLCLLLAASFTACSTPTSSEPVAEGSVSDSENAIPSQDVSKSDSPESTVQIPNPIEEQETPDFTEKLGFKVEDYPRADQLTRCATIGDLVGEMDFTLPQGTIKFRIAKDGGGDVSGISDNLIDTISSMDVNDISVTVRSFKDDPSQMLYGWIKDGYIFSLYFKDIDDSTHTSMIAEQFVEQMVMDPATARS